MKCLITERRWYLQDFPQGRLEVPCVYIFETANDNESTKTHKALWNGGCKLSFIPRQGDDSSSDLAIERSAVPSIKMENPVEISDVANLPQAQELIERPSSLNTERIAMGQRLTDEDINHS